MTHSGTRVVVIGGGVVGVCCAYYLAKRGAQVTLLERGEIGQGASFGNAGAIAPGHGPMNRPGRVQQAIKSLFNPLSPLYVVPRPDVRLARWLIDFARHCTAAHVEYGLRALAPLGHAAVELYEQLVQEEGLQCHYRRNGYYEVYRTEPGIAAAHHEVETMHRLGFGAQFLDGPALREREPALRAGVLGGTFLSQAATVNPHEFVLEMARRAEQLGVVVRTHSGVDRIMSENERTVGAETIAGERIEADSVVVAAGAHSQRLTQQLGLPLPLQAAKGYHQDRIPEPGRTPALRETCMLGEASVFCTPMDGFIRFAGTLEFSGINDRIRRARLEQLTNAAHRYFDGMDQVEARSEWCGLRPCLSDGLPAVGPIPGFEGAFVATGHAMLGLTLGPVTGRIIAELVLDGRSAFDLTAFRADRF